MSKLDIVQIESSIVTSPVACAVLLPPTYDASAEPLPLCFSLQDEPVLSDAGKAWMAWNQGGMKGDGPELSLESEEGLAVLRATFAAPKAEIEKSDPTIRRRYAELPSTRLGDL